LDYIVDQIKRYPKEWAKIYKIQLVNDEINEMWSEFEWAYNLFNLDYMLIPTNDDYEESELMEMRAMDIKRDIFQNADYGEKLMLKERYIDTSWVRQQMLLGE
jgi:hypothetical protein